MFLWRVMPHSLISLTFPYKCERHPSLSNGSVPFWGEVPWKVVGVDSCPGCESCGCHHVRILYLTKGKRGPESAMLPSRSFDSGGPGTWKQWAKTGHHTGSWNDWKWLWPGKEPGIFRTETSLGLTDDVLGMLQYGFFRKQIYPAWFGGHSFLPQ